MGASELGGPWTRSVALLRRLAAMLAASSSHNSMELALLSVRNFVNDAILHAQLHGPRITATVRYHIHHIIYIYYSYNHIIYRSGREGGDTARGGEGRKKETC